MADEGAITLSKDHVYGIVIVALVALLTISVFTSGFGIMPAKGGTTGGTCGTGTETGTGGSNASGTTGQYAGISTLSLSMGKGPVRGQGGAPVTWLEFSDFQCPYCSKLFVQVDKQVQTTYVDTGKVKMYFRHFPLSFHDKAEDAAMAVECANEQGKFWEMHDKLFEDQAAWSASSDVAASFKGYATGLGIDGTKFASCLSSSKYYSNVDSDLQEGQSYGVQGTPGVFLIMPKSKTDLAALKNVVSGYSGGMQLYQDNDNLIVFVGGAYPYAAFASVLNTVTY